MPASTGRRVQLLERKRVWPAADSAPRGRRELSARERPRIERQTGITSDFVVLTGERYAAASIGRRRSLVAVGIAGSGRVDTSALRQCDHRDALLGRDGLRIAPGDPAVSRASTPMLLARSGTQEVDI
jgi:hypothetical protein